MPKKESRRVKTLSNFMKWAEQFELDCICFVEF